MDSKTALSELKTAQESRKSAGDYYSEAEQKLGVGDARSRNEELRGLIRNTEASLKGVNESVAGRTRGNLVTEAQRSRLQALEEQPIAARLGEQQGDYSEADTSLRDLLSQAGQQAGFGYQSDADRIAGLQNQYQNIFQQEESARQEAQRKREEQQWLKQYNESRRQFDAQMAESAKSRQATMARIASLSTPSFSSAGAKAGAGSNPIYDPSGSGQIYGYDTPTSSFLTDAGRKQQEIEDRKAQRGTDWLSKSLGGIGDITGWF